MYTNQKDDLPMKFHLLLFLFVRRYRSFFNLPQTNVTNDQIVFAKGDFQFVLNETLIHGDTKQIIGFIYTGTLVGGDRNSPGKFWQLNANATESLMNWAGTTVSQVAIDAYGINGTISDGWHYAYIGAQVPMWNGGYKQLESFVGSVIRVTGVIYKQTLDTNIFLHGFVSVHGIDFFFFCLLYLLIA
jgi:hypothetical protein